MAGSPVTKPEAMLIVKALGVLLVISTKHGVAGREVAASEGASKEDAKSVLPVNVADAVIEVEAVDLAKVGTALLEGDGVDVADQGFDGTSNFTMHTLCSSECESSFCYVPPALRYGKYCGIGYTGCDGEAPCDGLDACCQTHDACIGDDWCNYLNVDCNQNLVDCLNAFQASGQPQFPGADCSTDELVSVINQVIEIGIGIGEKWNISGQC